MHPPNLASPRLFFLSAARKRGPVTPGMPDVKHYRKATNETERVEKLAGFFPPAVGLLRGGVPHMLHGRSPDPRPHAHHRRLFLRVSLLR